MRAKKLNDVRMSAGKLYDTHNDFRIKFKVNMVLLGRFHHLIKFCFDQIGGFIR